MAGGASLLAAGSQHCAAAASGTVYPGSEERRDGPVVGAGRRLRSAGLLRVIPHLELGAGSGAGSNVAMSSALQVWPVGKQRRIGECELLAFRGDSGASNLPTRVGQASFAEPRTGVAGLTTYRLPHTAIRGGSCVRAKSS